MMVKICLPILALVLALGAPSAGAANGKAAGSPDVEAQYLATLAAMKHPAASGVLVTEIGPNSPAGTAGLRAGDIIVRLAGRDVRTLSALRLMVADLLAGAAVHGDHENVPLAIRRVSAGNDAAGSGQVHNMTLQVPRRPLGIRAIEVQAGVSAALNPPASARGTIALGWAELRRLENGGGDVGQTIFMRTSETDGTWVGWQSRNVTVESDDALAGKLAISRIGLQDDKLAVVATEAVGFVLRTGDFKTAPAFLLESADVASKAGDGAIVSTTAKRAGVNLHIEKTTTFSTQVEGPVRREAACPANALVPAAVPLVAAAMPQEKNAVLALHLMSALDFVARPGYVLATCGRQPLVGEEAISSVRTYAKLAPAATKPAALAWRVDLMHCGVVVESYWFNDQRRLLRIDNFSGTTLTSRRVANEDEARVTAVPKTPAVGE